jgi:hypothetical protein
MKKNYSHLLKICLTISLFAAAAAPGQNEITIQPELKVVGSTKPIPVSLDGFSIDVADALKFDLYVQGFSFVAPDAAQYQISGTSTGSVQGRVVDRFAKSTILSRNYTGASLRRQAHAFADDIVQAITHKNGIAQTKIAFKAQGANGNGEIYVADFDGHNALAVTHDNTIVAAPAWAPGRPALYYDSYKLDNPDIWYHDLTTGQRRVVAHYSGSNISPAVSPGRLAGGDDFEQERQPGCVGGQRGWLEFETIDRNARGRIVAVLVAGRAMDLFRDEDQRTPRAGQSPGGRRGRSTHFNRRGAKSDRTRLVAGRQMDRVHVADGGFQHLRYAGGRQCAAGGIGGGRRPVMVAELADADFHAAHRRPLRVICA